MEDEREEGAIQFKFSVKYLIIILIVINLLKKSVGQWELTKCKFHIQSNMKLYICSSTLSFLSFTFTSVLRGISNGHNISHTNETLKHLVVDVLGNMLLYSVSLYSTFYVVDISVLHSIGTCLDQRSFARGQCVWILKCFIYCQSCPCKIVNLSLWGQNTLVKCCRNRRNGNIFLLGRPEWEINKFIWRVGQLFHHSRTEVIL